MSLINFFKAELNGWNRFEIFFLLFIGVVLLFNLFYLNDSLIAFVSAFCGIMYTLFAGKGKITCYLFGLLGTAFYSYLSWKNLLFGNLALYLCYYFPMQCIGIFLWKKNLRKDTQEIEKISLPSKECFFYFIVASFFSVVLFIVLYFCGDKNPFIDAVTTVFSCLGLFLTVRRCIEQWIVWMLVNGLSFIMWLLLIIDGVRAYSTLFMWAVYFVLAVYFYISWFKDIAKKNI